MLKKKNLKKGLTLKTAHGILSITNKTRGRQSPQKEQKNVKIR